MSDTDARMALNDMLHLKLEQPMIFFYSVYGFSRRSIGINCCMSHTELKTRTADTEIGTKIILKHRRLNHKHRFMSNW
jgi:hypothetical protein